jgi:hypothetical protein
VTTGAEWSEDKLNTPNDIYAMFQSLLRQGVLNRHLWRSFHCACCRAIWDYILETSSRRAVQVSELFLSGVGSLGEMQTAYIDAKAASDQAWSIVEALRIPIERDTWLWPVSEIVDRAWVRFCAADAAALCAYSAEDSVLFTRIPDSAASVLAWATAREEVLAMGVPTHMEQMRRAVNERWKQIEAEEMNRQAVILRALVDKTLL